MHRFTLVSPERRQVKMAIVIDVIKAEETLFLKGQPQKLNPQEPLSPHVSHLGIRQSQLPASRFTSGSKSSQEQEMIPSM